MTSLRDKIGEISEEKITDFETKLHAKEGENRSLRADNKRLLERNRELTDALETIAAISSQDRVASRPLRKKTSGEHAAIPIICWSDWHVAEVVTKSKTNGYNRYDPEIAKARARTNTESTIRLIDSCRMHVAIEEAVLILGGDFITGYLHEELAQTNAMGPVEESYFAQTLLEQEIQTFIEHSKLKKLRVVCHRGNHGRCTRKVQFKNDYETSYETWIYWNLRDRISGNGIEWVIPESDIHNTVLMPGYNLRTIHGHQIKFGGGIGGISVPLNRWIAKQDQTTPSVMTVLGHFHSFTPSDRFAINGSLKGWDEFAQSKGFPFEHPCQLLQLFDCKRKQVTARYPIFCE